MDGMKNISRAGVGLLLVVVGLQPASSADKVISEEQCIADIEARVVLPKGSHALAEYTRHYKFYGSRAHSRVEAAYIHEDGRSGVKIIKSGGLPKTLDGGCKVVNLIFTRAGKMISAQCNGVA